MITEISKRFNNQAKIGIALDPPSENICDYNVQGIYPVGRDGNLDGKRSPTEYAEGRSNFSGSFKFARSYVGRNSIAGNQDFAKTADESLWMDYDKHTDTGQQHGWVVEGYRNLVSKKQYLEQGVLSLNDKSKHSEWQRTKNCKLCLNKEPFEGHSGSVETEEPDNIRRLKVYIDNREKEYSKIN